MSNPSDDQRLHCEPVNDIVKLNPDIEEAKRLARNQDADLTRAFRALDAARDLKDPDLRMQFKA